VLKGPPQTTGLRFSPPNKALFLAQAPVESNTSRSTVLPQVQVYGRPIVLLVCGWRCLHLGGCPK
jgi:hypothetical protein